MTAPVDYAQDAYDDYQAGRIDESTAIVMVMAVLDLTALGAHKLLTDSVGPIARYSEVFIRVNESIASLGGAL